MKTLNRKTKSELVGIYNTLLETLQDKSSMTDRQLAGPNTFSTKKKAIARILKLRSALKKILNAEKSVKTTKPARGAVRALCESLLLAEDEDGIGSTYESMLAEVKERFPTAKTSVGCLRWYATKLREAGHIVPDRPRKKVSK